MTRFHRFIRYTVIVLACCVLAFLDSDLIKAHHHAWFGMLTGLAIGLAYGFGASAGRKAGAK